MVLVQELWYEGWVEAKDLNLKSREGWNKGTLYNRSQIRNEFRTNWFFVNLCEKRLSLMMRSWISNPNYKINLIDSHKLRENPLISQ